MKNGLGRNVQLAFERWSQDAVHFRIVPVFGAALDAIFAAQESGWIFPLSLLLKVEKGH